MKKTTLALSLIALIGQQGFAQTQKGTNADGFTKTATGLEYKIVKDVPGDNKPKTGDFVEVHLVTAIDDSVLFESKQMNEGKPVQFPLQPPAFKGDLVEGLVLLTPGDEAIFRIPIDTVIKAGTPTMPWMKPGTGQMMVYNINLVSVKSSAQMQQEQQAKAAEQNGVDDKLLQEYFAKNNIKPKKTKEGLYYTTERAGQGPLAQPGQKVTVNYTGKLMDGQVFDSNVDPQFQHVQPFEFALGQGQVIKGWDLGVAQLNKGAKATLYIPSSLAYGANGQGPIQPNSILIFDVEVVDIK